MSSQNKGKYILIQPTQQNRSSSSVSISSEEERNTTSTEKLMDSAIKIEYQHKPIQQHSIPYMGIASTTHNHNLLQGSRPQMDISQNIQHSYCWTGSSKNIQYTQNREVIIAFGNCTLPICFDERKKFRHMIGVNLIEDQQYLLNNL